MCNLKRKGFGEGSKPSTGNISDNQIHLILNIPKRTLTDWKKSNNYRRGLYWLLKSLKKDELLKYQKKSKKFYSLK